MTLPRFESAGKTCYNTTVLNAITRLYAAAEVTMRLTICDDDPRELAALDDCVRRYIRARGLALDVLCFSEAADLLRYETKNGPGEVYLLDVLMPGMNGIDLGREIHRRNHQAVILYLTTSPDFYPDAFSVRAFSYLLKPVDPDRLFQDLDECFSYLLPPRPAHRTVSVRTAEGTQVLDLGQVNAVEYRSHRLVYHMAGGGSVTTLYKSEPFAVLAQEYLDLGVFVRCAESYLVNMPNIKALTPGGFRMADGSEYSITRKYAGARSRFIDFEAES